jgi:hypothetical protein
MVIPEGIRVKVTFIFPFLESPKIIFKPSKYVVEIGEATRRISIFKGKHPSLIKLPGRGSNCL